MDAFRISLSCFAIRNMLHIKRVCRKKYGSDAFIVAAVQSVQDDEERAIQEHTNMQAPQGVQVRHILRHLHELQKKSPHKAQRIHTNRKNQKESPHTWPCLHGKHMRWKEPKHTVDHDCVLICG
jgi:hypothetical protein